MTVLTPEDTEVDRPKRSWPAEYTCRVMAGIDGAKASGDPAAVGEICRREGSYSSLRGEWRHQRDRGALAALSDRPAGGKPNDRRELE